MALYVNLFSRSGGFGTCYEARFQDRQVCIKQLNRTSKKLAALQSFEAETRQELFLFDHPNIVKIFAVSELSKLNEETVSGLMIVFEYVEGRSLQSVIDDQSVTIDFSRMCRFGHEIACALEYAHSFRIAHLDLKPANVMLTSCGTCKLIDFGCSQYIEDDPTTPTRSCLTGTFAYRAPELLKGGCPTAKCDVYALGVCLWQFWSRSFPFSGMNQHAVIFQVVSKNLRPTFNEGLAVHAGYKSLATRCWSPNPSDRPEMTDVKTDLVDFTKLEEISAHSVKLLKKVEANDDHSMKNQLHLNGINKEQDNKNSNTKNSNNNSSNRIHDSYCNQSRSSFSRIKTLCSSRSDNICNILRKKASGKEDETITRSSELSNADGIDSLDTQDSNEAQPSQPTIRVEVGEKQTQRKRKLATASDQEDEESRRVQPRKK